MADVDDKARLIVEVLLQHIFRYVNEGELQDGIWAVLVAAGLDPQREVHLDARSRIDFMVGRIGIEVKVDGSLSALIRQAMRYAKHDGLDEIVIVTTLSRHLNMPDTLNDKRITVAHLSRGAF